MEGKNFHCLWVGDDNCVQKDLLTSAYVQSNLLYPDLQYTGTSLYRTGSTCTHVHMRNNISAQTRVCALMMASKQQRSVMCLKKC